MKKKLNVVHLQYSTESAGRAALRLHKAFLLEGINSSIITLQADEIPPTDKIQYLGKRAVLLAIIDSKLQAYRNMNTIKKFGLFSYPILGTNIAGMEKLKNADFIYIHWALNGFLNFNSIEEIAKLNKPVIVFMHDMWAITGGCHYSFDCQKYKTKCGNCQMFAKAKKNDFSEVGFNKKIKLFSKYNNLFFVAPSKWLYDCAKQSALTKDKLVKLIPNLLDNIIFKPFDKNTAKQALNIDTSDRVIAFGAVSIENAYKGWPFLKSALQLLKQDISFKNTTVIIFGSGYNKEIEEAIPFKTQFMGYLEDEYSTALVYNAADVFIAPSLVEAFGYVIMEALSCGTPVVGFEVGGILDMIKHKENGYIAKYKDAEDVCTGIKFCMQNAIKGYMLPNFDPKSTVNKHLQLFNEIENP
jgi:glycosyltransferase involved in cell wall biosynthesis